MDTIKPYPSAKREMTQGAKYCVTAKEKVHILKAQGPERGKSQIRIAPLACVTPV